VVSSDLSIDLELVVLLFEDDGVFSVGQGVLELLPEDNADRDAFS
jgi:hypothetical protein